MTIYSDASQFAATNYDVLVVGAGYSGAVFARRYAELKPEARIAIIEKRAQIAGNAHDFIDDAGVMVHLFGPHIFHTHMKEVYDFLSQFTKWLPYEHRVLANIHGTLVPVPFNKTSLEISFGKEKSELLYQELVEEFGEETKVPISKLRASDNENLQEVADYIYENIFLHYTMKQWDKKPEEIDGAVTARVPIHISEDDRYFQDVYQGMPKEGYTKMFEKMLTHPNIDVFLKTELASIAELSDNTFIVQGSPFKGLVIYSGPVDELFSSDMGALPYRSIDMRFEQLDMKSFQEAATVNYTTTEDFTRITEFKKMTGQEDLDKTTILKEYPQAYVPGSDIDPYYPISNPENQALYEKYAKRANMITNLYVLGRLGQYRYYDMDDTTKAALDLAEELAK